MRRIISFMAEHSILWMPVVGLALLAMSALLIFMPELAGLILRWCAAALFAAAGLWLLAAFIRYLTTK